MDHAGSRPSLAPLSSPVITGCDAQDGLNRWSRALTGDRSRSSTLGLPRPADGGPLQVTQTLWLSSEMVDGTTVTVIDGPPTRAADERYLVLQGPCYLARATALRHDSPPDGIVR